MLFTLYLHFWRQLKLSMPTIPHVTCYYRLHPNSCSAVVFPGFTTSFFPFLLHTLLSFLVWHFTFQPPPVRVYWRLPCRSLHSKTALFNLSQEASATSSPLTTPVSHGHSVILFFSSQNRSLSLRCTEQETIYTYVCEQYGNIETCKKKKKGQEMF